MRDLRHIQERQAATPVMGEILAYFEDGKRKTRSQASKEIVLSERQFRANVAELNKLGYPIISDGKHFFLAKEVSEIIIARKRLESAQCQLGIRIQSLLDIEKEFIRRSEGTNQLKLL